MSAPRNCLLLTAEDARDFVRTLLDRAREELETTVAEDFKEARRLAPTGVESNDMVIAVTKAMREWRP